MHAYLLLQVFYYNWFSTSIVNLCILYVLLCLNPHFCTHMLNYTSTYGKSAKLTSHVNWQTDSTGHMTAVWISLHIAITIKLVSPLTNQQFVYMYVNNSYTPLFSLQSTVVIPLLPWMVPLIHIKTQLRELRYSSDVTQVLFHLGGWQQCVEQIEGGTLTLLIIGVHVRMWCHRHSKIAIYTSCTFVPVENSKVFVSCNHIPLF